MMLLPLVWSLGTLLGLVSAAGLCFFSSQRAAAQQAMRIRELEQQADRAAAAADQGDSALTALARRSGLPTASLHRDSLREPLLEAIPEDPSDAMEAALPVQTLDELPRCVSAFLAKAIRDGRRFKCAQCVCVWGGGARAGRGTSSHRLQPAQAGVTRLA